MFDQTRTNPAIVQTIIILARNLGLGVVAEGVETETQYDELIKLGCDSAQGFYFAHPMDLLESISFVSSGAKAGAEPQSKILSTFQCCRRFSDRRRLDRLFHIIG